MEDNKPKNDQETNKIEEPQTQPVAMPADDANDDVATAEEIAAYARRSAEKRAEKRKRGETESGDSEFGEFIPPDSLIDPYEEPDPQVPHVKYEETPFLARGCRQCPKAYQPVSSVETMCCGKMTITNWLSSVRQPCESFDVVEVRFKNNRKDFFRLPAGLEVAEGDVVAVEGMPGHDIGIVSLTGELCRIQMKKRKIDPASDEIRKLFRRAKPADIEKWVEAIGEEKDALQRTRKIVDCLGLVMKVDDVEMQGDHTKAIFYYTADDRVDFRSLIKVLAEEFRVRIEMRQIGVRQEAARVGGLGTCGRELCCSTWLTNFKSVTTGSAKVQQLHPNPQKLAGQCGKLKCCLNFEAEVYADAMKRFPPSGTAIRFQKGLALHKKTDVLRGIMWYVYEGDNELHAITADDVKKVMEMNRNQQYPERLEDYQVQLMSTSGLQQESNAVEFESELMRMADAGEGRNAKGRDRKEERRDNREGSPKNAARPDRNGRQQRPDREQRPPKAEGQNRQQPHPRKGEEPARAQNRQPKKGNPNGLQASQPHKDNAPAGQPRQRQPQNRNRHDKGGEDTRTSE